MKTELSGVLNRIGERYRDSISEGGRHYLEVDIGKEAERLGHADLGAEYHNVNAVIPLKEAASGMKVRIDGRTWVDYAQFDTGVVVPRRVAKETRLPYKHYEAQDSMILNFP